MTISSQYAAEWCRLGHGLIEVPSEAQTALRLGNTPTDAQRYVPATLVLNPKGVYGRELFYPACDRSRAFASLLKRKSFDSQTLDAIKALGFLIDVQREVTEGGY